MDGKAYYVFGRDSALADIVLIGSGPSRVHAALVHHEDGKTYLIDLQSVSARPEPHVFECCDNYGLTVCC